MEYWITPATPQMNPVVMRKAMTVWEDAYPARSPQLTTLSPTHVYVYTLKTILIMSKICKSSLNDLNTH